MRILLVKPHAELVVARRLQQAFLHLEPLELEIVAGAVPPEDEVEILDLSVEEQPERVFRSALQQMPPDVLGLGGYSSNAHTVKKLAGICRELTLKTLVVVGGIHATVMPSDYAVEQIDVIVRGEGGTAFREILRRLKAGEDPWFDDRALSPKEPDFQQIAAGDTPAYPDLDDIPAPRRDLVDRSRYFCVWTSSPTKKLASMFPRVASVRTSVGCRFACSFCIVSKIMHRKYLQRTPEDVADELAELKEDYIYFVDDEMFLNAERARHMAQLLLERGIHKHYISWARSDTIVKHADVLRKWKEAGLSALYVGLEVMDDAGLDAYNKKISAATNREAVKVLRELGITLHACFIVNPDFTNDDFDRLEQEVRALKPAEITFTVLSPSPGTPMWYSRKGEFICHPFQYYDCMHTVFPTRLPLKRFYARFARMTSIALQANPLRVNRIRAPIREVVRAIFHGTRYIFALRGMYRDYEVEHE